VESGYEDTADHTRHPLRAARPTEDTLGIGNKFFGHAKLSTFLGARLIRSLDILDTRSQQGSQSPARSPVVTVSVVRDVLRCFSHSNDKRSPTPLTLASKIMKRALNESLGNQYQALECAIKTHVTLPSTAVLAPLLSNWRILSTLMFHFLVP
jgi:hypothetical protein